LAERIAQTLPLGLASIDFASDDDGRIVVRVSGSPRLGLYERISGARVADAILNELEARARVSASIDAELDEG
jgi:glutathione synthase/RimK-type ligase-like ATP-grasp enzyme